MTRKSPNIFYFPSQWSLIIIQPFISVQNRFDNKEQVLKD